MTMEAYHEAAQGHVPVLQIIGYKNSGKTTLACRLIHALSARGIRVGSAKHDAHGFTLDDPGTDSSRHLLHGAVETVLTSPQATRVMRQAETPLEEIVQSMKGRVDLVIVEGFKSAPYPKIALLRHMDDRITLEQEATNIRLWLSRDGAADGLSADTGTAEAGAEAESPAPAGGMSSTVLPMCDQELVDREVLNLALALLG